MSPLSVTQRFAELLADGFSVADIERKLSYERPWGNETMQRIRRKLGWQAR